MSEEIMCTKEETSEIVERFYANTRKVVETINLLVGRALVFQAEGQMKKVLDCIMKVEVILNHGIGILTPKIIKEASDRIHSEFEEEM